MSLAIIVKMTTEEQATKSFNVRLSGDVRRFVETNAKKQGIGGATYIANLVRNAFVAEGK